MANLLAYGKKVVGLEGEVPNDTGWVTVVTNKLKYRKVDSVVTIIADLKEASNTWKAIGTLPQEVRPPYEVIQMSNQSASEQYRINKSSGLVEGISTSANTYGIVITYLN